MKERNTKRKLAIAVMSMFLCISLIVGTTMAWFTDSAVSSGNVIKSGTLDVEMKWADGQDNPTDDNTVWHETEGTNAEPIFDYRLWEPGFTSVRHIEVMNNGSLALKYNLTILPTGNVDAAWEDLAEVIDVYAKTPAVQVSDRADVDTLLENIGTLREIMDDASILAAKTQGHLLAGEKKAVVTLALKMSENAGNQYQNLTVNNGFAVKLFATQYTYENDTFDDQYDKDAPMEVDAPAQQDELTTEDQTFTSGNVSVTVSAGGAYKSDVFTFSESVQEIVVDPVNGLYTLMYDIGFRKNGERIESGDTEYTVIMRGLPKGARVDKVLHTVGTDEIEVTGFTYDTTYDDESLNTVTFKTKTFSLFAAQYRKLITVTYTSPRNSQTTDPNDTVSKTSTMYSGEKTALTLVSVLDFPDRPELHLFGWNEIDASTGQQTGRYFPNGSEVVFTEDTLLNAVWRYYTTVTFLKGNDDVQGEMPDQFIPLSVATELNKNAYTLSGYAFDYWEYIPINGECANDLLIAYYYENKFTDGQSLEVTYKNPIVLKAVWKKLV